MRLNEGFANIDMEGGLYSIFQDTLKMEQQGKKIIHMEIGKPDFDSPTIAKEASKKALDEGFVHYTAMIGIPELREAIAFKEKRDNDMVFDPETEIVVTAGCCEALTCTMQTIFQPGDEIIIPSPLFQVYWDSASLLGLKIVEVPLRIDNDYEISVEDLKAAVSPRTRGILINTPSNPTGKVIGLAKLEEIAAFAKEYNLFVISDEAYDGFIFDGKHYSIRNIEGMAERTFVTNATSKTFSMTGWRVGYIITPAKYQPYLTRAHQNMSTCANSFAQKGAATAYREAKPYTEAMVKEFKARRDILLEGLGGIEGIETNRPEGAFYLFVRVSKLGVSGSEFCRTMLQNGVALTPGTVFGSSYQDYIRISYACSREDIKAALEIFVKVAAELRERRK